VTDAAESSKRVGGIYRRLPVGSGEGFSGYGLSQNKTNSNFCVKTLKEQKKT